MFGSSLDPRTLLDHLPVAVTRLDRDLRHLYANRAALDLFGIAPEALLGKTMAEIGTVPAEICRLWNEAQHAVLSGSNAACFQFRCVVRGSARHYAVAIAPERASDETVETLLNVASDITDAMRQTDRHPVPTEVQVKDAFFADLSHELRTPLNAILGWAQIARAGNTSLDRALHALAQVEQSARIQATVVDDLLRLSDSITGKLNLEMRPVHLAPLVSATFETLRPLADAKSIRLEAALQPEADLVWGDVSRLQRILWNLANYAASRSPANGRMAVSLSGIGSFVVLRVTLTGDDAAFGERPAHEEGTAPGSARALGPGLAVTRHLLALQGGGLEIRRTTVVARFAKAQGLVEPGSLNDAHIGSRGLPLHGGPQTLARVSVLAVDDDRNTREMLCEVLERAGARVFAAASAAEALDKLQRLRPDILLSDIGMPEADGCDLIRKIRALPRHRGGATPAMALTGYARDDDRAAALAAGYQAVATKPVDLGQLLSAIVDLARTVKL